jgi:TRAP-type C4-dicarboxylate transport system substrate-binding protein
MLRRYFMAGALSALSMSFSSVEAAAQSRPVTIRLGHVLTDSHSWHVASKGFAEQVARETQGRVNIQVFSGGQLGSEREVVEGLQIGTVQAGVIGSGSFQPIEPKMGIVELPYAWPTREKAFAAFDGDLGAALDKLLLAKNIVVLSWWENGYRHVTNSKRPINKPEDLKGLKIRVTPDKVRLDTFVALGAEPAPLAFGELYSALKYLSLTGHVWGAACLVVSKSVWDRIGADDQKLVKTAAAKWRDEQRKMITESDADFTKKLEEKGMTINKVDTVPFVSAVQQVWKSQEAIYGPEFMSLLNKYRQ